jgi:hypothetical protein
MSRFLNIAVLGLTLTGGVAMADGVRVDVRGPRVEEVHYRDQHRRPEVRVERPAYRSGYRWHAGEWRWEANEWQWHGGWYVRG